MNRNAPRSARSPGERRAPSQCASRGAERHAREGCDTTTDSAPSTPTTFRTMSAACADHSETHTVTSSGPTVNMTSCATASMAYAVCTWSSRGSTFGHSARSPPSRGGVNRLTAPTAMYASAGAPVPAKAKTVMARADTSAAGSCTRGCPRRSTKPAEQRLSHRVGDAVHRREGPGQAVRAALGAHEQHDRDGGRRVRQPPHQGARQQPRRVPRLEDLRISRGHRPPSRRPEAP